MSQYQSYSQRTQGVPQNQVPPPSLNQPAQGTQNRVQAPIPNVQNIGS